MVLHQTKVSDHASIACVPSELMRAIRPGLVEFLDKLKHKYEMHVYTMGTRAYALEVCKALDPDQSIFGHRILTRDESGSESGNPLLRTRVSWLIVGNPGMTSKNLQRLFPSDQSMVAIIDDRSDVWADVPNLVKVNPCELPPLAVNDGS